jgi:hypothetical protein
MSALARLIGAISLSAAGSLSLHLAPFVTAALIADSKTSIAGAGSIRSAAQLGELAIAVLLPILGVVRVSSGIAAFAAAALLAGFILADGNSFLILGFGWLIIGASSGSLKYLGTTSIAKAANLTFAFSLRLSAVLILAGITSLILLYQGSLQSYDRLLAQVLWILAPLLLIGLLLYRAERSAGFVAKNDGEARRPASFSGIVAVYIFFVGLSGVIVFVLHQAVVHGVALRDSALAIAAAKILAGLGLFTSSNFDLVKKRPDRFLLQAMLLAAGTIIMFFSYDFMTLFAGLLFWEIAVNHLSARLQAAVVKSAPYVGGLWLNAAILLGGATGPFLNGMAISLGYENVYLILNVALAFVPVIWNKFWRPALLNFSTGM